MRNNWISFFAWWALLLGCEPVGVCIELAGAPYPYTLQEALDAAEPCSTVEVSGEIWESVVIRKPVTIKGLAGARLMGVPGAATVTVTMDEDLLLPGGECPYLTDSACCSVSISDLSMVAPQGHGGGQSALAIERSSAVTLARVEIEALQQRPAPSIQRGLVQLQSGLLVMKDGVSLQGSSQWHLPALSAEDGSSVFFLGRSSISAPGGDGMVLRSSRLIWQDSTVASAGGRALDLSDGFVSIGSASISSTGEECLRLRDATADLLSVTLLNCGGNAITSASSRIQLRETDIVGPGAAGLSSDGGFVALDRSAIVKTGAGCVSLLGTEASVRSVDLVNCEGTGLHATAGQTLVEDTVVDGTGGSGLQAVGGQVTVHSTTVSNTGADCVNLLGLTSELKTVDMRRCGEGGMVSITSETQVTDVTVDGAGKAGVEVDSGTLSGSGLTVSHTQGHGVELQGQLSTRDDQTVELDGVTVSSVGQSGVFLSFVNATLQELSVTTAANHGLEMVNSFLAVHGLSIDGSYRAGIDGSTGSYISCDRDCRITDAYDGVVLRYSDGVFSNATVGATRTAVDLDGPTVVIVKDSVLNGGVTGLRLNHDENSVIMIRVDILKASENAVSQSAGKLTWSESTAQNANLDGVYVSGGSIDLAKVALLGHGQNGMFITGEVDASLVNVNFRENGLHGLSCDGGAEDPDSSNVSLNPCYYSEENNHLAPLNLINGCQQNVCTEVRSMEALTLSALRRM